MTKEFIYGNWMNGSTAEFKAKLNSMTKEELLKEIDKSIDKEKNNKARNIMGCSESIYNGYYDVACLFTKKELNAMSKQEIINIIITADTVAAMLY